MTMSSVGSKTPAPPTTAEALAQAILWLKRDVDLVLRDHRTRHGAGDGVGGSLRELANYLTAALRRENERQVVTDEMVDVLVRASGWSVDQPALLRDARGHFRHALEVALMPLDSPNTEETR
jgi:hypothetical protein